MFEKILEAIDKGQAFALIAHISPDGDTLGSSVALCLALRKKGKRAFVLCDDAVPLQLSMLPCKEEIMKEPTAFFDTAIAVDCSDVERMGGCGEFFNAANTKVVIDHHLTNGGFGQVWYVDSKAPSTGEIIYDLIFAMNVDLDYDMATALYIAIATDTGGFMYANTMPSTHNKAATLLMRGIPFSQLSNTLFKNVRPEKMRLVGLCINNTKFAVDNKLGYAILLKKEVEALGADYGDFDGLIDCIRSIDTVEVAAIFRETPEGLFKMSLRTESVDATLITKKYGGGGHVRAAGATVTKEEVVVVLRELASLL